MKIKHYSPWKKQGKINFQETFWMSPWVIPTLIIQNKNLLKNKEFSLVPKKLFTPFQLSNLTQQLQITPIIKK